MNIKTKRLVALVVLFMFLFIALILVNFSYAQWSAISSGYAVTTNWHGEEVPLGESVTAWAGTNNSDVYQVRFLWKNSTGHVVFNETDTSLVNYTTPNVPPGAPDEIVKWANDHPGYEIWYANNTQIPNSIGNWSVQVFFYAPGGHLKGKCSDIVRIRATSFEVIPLVPFLGTAGVTATALFSLGLKKLRQRIRKSK